jgi:tetratricopeptide (TPR) repeat protein
MEMRRWFIVLMMLIVSMMSKAQNDILEQAAEAYRLYDYQTAIVLYEDVLNAGQHSGTLLYNLGNAYYAVGDFGMAMLNYRRAALYMPRDSDLNISIARLHAERTTFVGAETDPLNQLGELTTDVFTLYEFSLIVFVAWVVFFALMAIRILRSVYTTDYRIIITTAGVILLTGVLLLGSRLYIDMRRPSAIILPESAPVMSGPGEDYLPIYDIYAGAEVRVMAEVGDWVRFALPDRREGWILRNNLGYVITNWDKFGIK